MSQQCSQQLLAMLDLSVKGSGANTVGSRKRKQRESAPQLPPPPEPPRKRLTPRPRHRAGNLSRAELVTLESLGIGSVPAFLARPWKDRQKVYSAILTHPHPLHLKDMILWDERGTLWADDPALPRGARLLDERQTGNPRLTQEAREYFYGQNVIVASMDMPWLHYSIPEEGCDAARWLQRVQVVCYNDPTDPYPGDHFSETCLWIVHVLRHLTWCDRLDYVILELRGTTPRETPGTSEAQETRQRDVTLLGWYLSAEEDMLRVLDDRLRRGVLVVRECAWDQWGRCLRSQAIRLSWWDQAKVACMEEVEAEWRQSSQVQSSPLGSWEAVAEELPTGGGDGA